MAPGTKLIIECGDYLGTCCIYPLTDHLRPKNGRIEVTIPGDQTNLRLQIGDDWWGGIRFDFAGGAIVLREGQDLPEEKASYERNVFTLRTKHVTVEFGLFRGVFKFGRAGWVTHDEPGINLVPGGRYAVATGVVKITWVYLKLEGHFEPDHLDCVYAFTTSGNCIKLRTRRMRVNPAGYKGNLALEWVNRKLAADGRTDLVPLFTYRLLVGSSGWPHNHIAFAMDSCGHLVPHASQINVARSVCEMNKDQITLRTTQVTVKVSESAGPWSIKGVTPRLEGERELILVTDIGYRLVLHGAVTRTALFQVNVDGMVKPQAIQLGGHTFQFTSPADDRLRYGEHLESLDSGDTIGNTSLLDWCNPDGWSYAHGAWHGYAQFDRPGILPLKAIPPGSFDLRLRVSAANGPARRVGVFFDCKGPEAFKIVSYHPATRSVAPQNYREGDVELVSSKSIQCESRGGDDWLLTELRVQRRVSEEGTTVGIGLTGGRLQVFNVGPEENGPRVGLCVLAGDAQFYEIYVEPSPPFVG